MNAEFHLFDVDHGQCAAFRSPKGQWCLFDVGGTVSFSPVRWIVGKETAFGSSSPLALLPATRAFKFLKATVSHYHGDHLTDWQNLVKYSPEFIRTVDPDQEYMTDSRQTNTGQSWPLVCSFVEHVRSSYLGSGVPDYGGASIVERSLPVNVARHLGGNASSRVNNASIVSRIEVYGNSILLCGDMMKEAWEAIIADRGPSGTQWRSFLSNIDVLVAPHHGHRTGYSVDLMNLVKPAVVLVSAVAKDPNVDSRYSQAPVRGIGLDGTYYRSISTRHKGHIRIDVAPPQTVYGSGVRTWVFGNTSL